ncbi:MAG: 50S ribosomal protein L13 [Patescibacteria group bacterium]|uniref:Large ribosomal subunit protein uL13 n=1 Tax=candidate division WWE3 bacterium TaxID=2053526 RepID=A0A955ECJ0_UNCKA|nr:50S ribosomal protein L13 [candidate division WWE3 bacterium]
MQFKTTVAKQNLESVDWHHIDATDITLGRLATRISKILLGKHKALYSPNVISNDKIVVTNAKSIAVTGNKLLDKIYYRHTGFPGGIRETNYGQMQEKDPTKALRLAVKGMLPKNKLNKKRLLNLYIYGDNIHPHGANLAERTTND